MLINKKRRKKKNDFCSFRIIVNIVMLLIIKNKRIKKLFVVKFLFNIQNTSKQIHKFVVALSFFYDVGSFFHLNII